VLPGIVALSQRPEQFRLAISVHAPADDLRRSLMPVNVKYPLADVIAAARRFQRRVTFEYVMLGGVNDAIEHAIGSPLARDCGAFVNLIHCIPVAASSVPSLRWRSALHCRAEAPTWKWPFGRPPDSISRRPAVSAGGTARGGAIGGKHGDVR
jgi:23S rRNA (adenine2503-C2)-methyltransferase